MRLRAKKTRLRQGKRSRLPRAAVSGPMSIGGRRRCRFPMHANTRSRSRSPCCRARRSDLAAVRSHARDHERWRRSPTSNAVAKSEARTSNITAAPRRMADAAIPYSMPGTGTPMSPSIPPNAMTSGNATGSTQMAGTPSCAPHRPTATIASTWSSPEIGCTNPVRKPAAAPCCTCAKAGAGVNSMMQSKIRNPNIETRNKLE